MSLKVISSFAHCAICVCQAELAAAERARHLASGYMYGSSRAREASDGRSCLGRGGGGGGGDRRRKRRQRGQG